MEFEELLNAVETAYTNAGKSNLDISHPDDEDLIFLLRCNYFEFDGKYYINKQIIRCSMGAVPSPNISYMRNVQMYKITRYIQSQV